MKIFTMGHHPDSTVVKRNAVIGMLTVGMMNKQVHRHFQACECTSLKPNRRAVSKIDIIPTDNVRPSGERTFTM